MSEEKKFRCEECKFCKKYEQKPETIMGRIWKWHTGWCPSWKKYQNYLNEKSQSATEKK